MSKEPKWRLLTRAEITAEYQNEYINKKLGKMTNDKFPTLESWIEFVSALELTSISPSADDKMAYRSHARSRADLRRLISTYPSWGSERRNMETFIRLCNGIDNGDTFPAPVVFRFSDGRMRIVSGNTRADAFRIDYPNKPYKAIVIDV